MGLQIQTLKFKILKLKNLWKNNFSQNQARDDEIAKLD
jgi:hypothetical protein